MATREEEEVEEEEEKQKKTGARKTAPHPRKQMGEAKRGLIQKSPTFLLFHYYSRYYLHVYDKKNTPNQQPPWTFGGQDH